jgi:hypothetical protein
MRSTGWVLVFEVEGWADDPRARRRLITEFGVKDGQQRSFARQATRATTTTFSPALLSKTLVEISLDG